ncbi:MAG: M15 family metallopeptidase, partial [Bacteroidota bacterium]
MIKGNAFNQDSPVPIERLRLLTIQHVDFEGNTKTGQMIVLDACADAVLKIFETLYERSFPIHKMQLIHHYQGDDEQSMAANNSSAHNCRTIAGADKLSLHAYGVAIDINPIQNPCVYIDYDKGVATYAPKTGIQYANRRLERPGKTTRVGLAEEVVAIFAENGF